MSFLLPNRLVKVIEPLTGCETEGITIQPLELWGRVLGDVGGGVLLTIGTRENTRKILKKDIHVGGLIGVHDGATGRTEPFGEDVKIGPEGGAPFGRFLDEEGRNDLCAGGALSTTITGHGLTMV